MGICVMIAVVIFMNAMIFPRGHETASFNLNLEKHRAKRELTCRPVEKYAEIDGLTDWCNDICNNHPDYCPEDEVCVCN